MSQAAETHTGEQPAPVRVSRTFRAPRALVFSAWTSAEHVQRWFCPEAFTIPQAKVEPHAGGAFEVCMRGPDGVDHWSRGSFIEVSPVDRLVIGMNVADQEGRPIFHAHTVVSFTEVEGGTTVDVVQTYTFTNPAMAAPMVKGAPIGWSQTLDKLGREIARLQGASLQN